METLFGLIACTGLRISEALALLDADVDLKVGVLTIRQSKFGKSRLVPLHPSAVEALARYRAQRARHVRSTPESPFFVGTPRAACWVSRSGERQVHRVFDDLRDQLGWVDRGAMAAPRIHDLRHSLRRAPAGALARAGRGHRPADAGAVDLPRPRQGLQHLLVPHRRAGADGAGCGQRSSASPSTGRTAMSKPPTPRAHRRFAALVQSFFTEYLTQQRAMSPRTVATYRDAFVLFLDFATAQLRKAAHGDAAAGHHAGR